MVRILFSVFYSQKNILNGKCEGTTKMEKWAILIFHLILHVTWLILFVALVLCRFSSFLFISADLIGNLPVGRQLAWLLDLRVILKEIR